MSNPQICPSLKSFMKKNFNQYSKLSIDIPELLLIQQQSDLISELVKMPGLTRYYKKINNETIELSVSTIQNTRHQGYSQSTTSLLREQYKYFNQTSLDEALKEIKKYCSWSTYSFVRQKFRATDQNRFQLRLQKQVKYNQELMRRCMKLSNQVQQLKNKLQAANDKIKSDQRKRVVRDQSTNLQKNKIFLKWQKSLLYKQKLQLQTKKNLNKQFLMLEQQKKLNQSIRQQIIQLSAKLIQLKNQKIGINLLIDEIKQIVKIQRNLSKCQHEEFNNMQKQLQNIFRQLKNTIGFLQ